MMTDEDNLRQCVVLIRGLMAERDSLRADLAHATREWKSAQQRAIDWAADSDAANDRARDLETLIFEAHGRAFGSRNYVYTDSRCTLDLLLADLNATQHERDTAVARAEKAEQELSDALRCSGDNAKAWIESVEQSAINRTQLLAEVGLGEQRIKQLKSELRTVQVSVREAEKLFEKAKKATEVPAAQWVPALGEAWNLIDQGIQRLP